ncbi:MAG: gluconate 2-dehydrogenase subunit 3 family protein [Bacteroidia bacterium]|nr:gluconate 2-dehydrogenase subunit 3 family protein [Bacteroidia bacterium]
MNRREAISTVALIMGGTVVGAQAFLTGCMPGEPHYEGLLTPNNYERLMDEIAETILPETETSPGAKAAKTGRFMNVIVTECYDEKEQKIFLDGIIRLEETVNRLYGKTFRKLSPEQRHEFLLTLESEIKDYDSKKGPGDPESHYYKMMKQLSLLGFLTSEIGSTKAMRHVAVPGRFDPCIPYAEGEKAFSG